MNVNIQFLFANTSSLENIFRKVQQNKSKNKMLKEFQILILFKGIKEIYYTIFV